jgi:hypothetical protein
MLALEPESLKLLGEIFDRLCLTLAGQHFSRDLLAKRLLQHVEEGVDFALLPRRVLRDAPLSYSVHEGEQCGWQLLYHGQVVESGVAETLVAARAAAMEAGAAFRLQ